METTQNHIVEDIFLIIGDIIVCIYFISPILTFIIHFKKKMQIQYLPILQVLSIIFNCLFWITSTVPSIDNIKDNLKTLIINVIGLIIGLLFLFLCWIKSYSENPDMFILILNIFNIFFQVAFGTYYAIKETYGKIISQIIAGIFNVLMYLSLLQNPLINYYQHKYQKYSLPFIQIFVGLASTIIWFIYGILSMKYEVIIPNVIAIIFLIAILIFCKIITKIQYVELNEESEEQNQIIKTNELRESNDSSSYFPILDRFDTKSTEWL